MTFSMFLVGALAVVGGLTLLGVGVLISLWWLERRPFAPTVSTGSTGYFYGQNFGAEEWGTPQIAEAAPAVLQRRTQVTLPRSDDAETRNEQTESRGVNRLKPLPGLELPPPSDFGFNERYSDGVN